MSELNFKCGVCECASTFMCVVNLIKIGEKKRFKKIGVEEKIVH